MTTRQERADKERWLNEAFAHHLLVQLEYARHQGVQDAYFKREARPDRFCNADHQAEYLLAHQQTTQEMASCSR